MEINWNIDKIAEGYGDTREEFMLNMNCNSMSAPAERTVARLVNGTVKRGQAAYDVVAGDAHWSSNIEVRNMRKKVSFAPSTATGVGRSFNKDAFYDKLEQVDSYVVLDMNPLFDKGGKPLAYEIPAETVKDLYELKVLGKDARHPFSKRQQYPSGWEGRLRFEELFPYSTFKFEPNCDKKDYPTAQELRDEAIERIEKERA